VNCYEAKQPLTVEHAKKFSTVNPRCGTSFMLFVILISIIVYIFIPIDYSFWVKLSLRLALLPLIAGISYEVLKLGARYCNNIFFRAISTPGMLVQRITTQEPDDRQMEVALFSLKKALK